MSALTPFNSSSYPSSSIDPTGFGRFITQHVQHHKMTPARLSDKTATIFTDPDAKEMAGHCSRYLKQHGYKVIMLGKDEDEVLTWAGIPTQRENNIEICAGHELNPDPWMQKTMMDVVIRIAESGFTPYLRATVASMPPILDEMMKRGLLPIGITNFERVGFQSKLICPEFPFLIVTLNRSHQRYLLKELTRQVVIMPSSPESEFTSHFLYHLRSQSQPLHQTMTIFSPKIPGESTDFYSRHMHFYDDVLPIYAHVNFAQYIARSPIAVLRRLQGDFRTMQLQKQFA